MAQTDRPAKSYRPLSDTPARWGRLLTVASDREVGAFDERAREYESGWRGRFHHQIADEVGSLALDVAPSPRCVLDVGCGTGYLLRELAEKPSLSPDLLWSRRGAADDRGGAVDNDRPADELRSRRRGGSPLRRREFRPSHEHDLIRPLARSEARPRGMREGSRTRGVSRARRPVLALAPTDPFRQPPGASPNQKAPYASADEHRDALA
jgi:SAM-dependent methyltransferase